MSIRATRVSAEPSAPGEFQFFSPPSDGLFYMCPCGCGALGALPFRGTTDEHPSWIWDGNADSPTLTPSILRTAGCRWHGYLTRGEWVNC